MREYTNVCPESGAKCEVATANDGEQGLDYAS